MIERELQKSLRWALSRLDQAEHFIDDTRGDGNWKWEQDKDFLMWLHACRLAGVSPTDPDTASPCGRRSGGEEVAQ